MRIILCLIAAITIIGACKQTQAVLDPDEDFIVLSEGSPFCHGACCEATAITMKKIIQEKKSHCSADSTVLAGCTEAMDSATWSELNASFSWDEFTKLPPRIGCPGCADGKVNTLEIRRGKEVHTVAFEDPDTPESLQELVAKVRQIREGILAQHPECGLE